MMREGTACGGPHGSVLPGRTGQAARGAAWGWVCLALVLAFQYGLFRQYVEREVAWCYPRNCDQSIYLAQSYDCYEQVLAHGFWQGLLARPQSPNGLLLELEGAMTYLVLGPSRLSALTVNFAFYAIFQVALALTLRWYSGRWSFALLGVGLLLTAVTPFYYAGGIADFRMDFSAFCLFGTFLCVVVRSGLLRSRRWAAAAGAVAAWLVLQRHLTAVYLAGVGAAGFAWLLVAWLVSARNPAARRLAGRRLVGLGVAGAVLATLTGLPILYKLPALRAYYLGQFGRSENVLRGQIYGTHTGAERLRFYFDSVVFDHAGVAFLALSGVLLVAALGLGLLRLRLRAAPAARPRPSVGVAAFAAISLAVPFCVLTLFNSPSPVVGDVMMGPLVLLVLALAFIALRVGGTAWDSTTRGSVAALAGLALAAGACVQVGALGRHEDLPPARRAGYEQAGLLYDRIADYCRRTGCSRPVVACNSMSDSLYFSVLQPAVFERQGLLLSPHQLLAGSTAVPEAEAVEAVRCSDIVVMARDEEGEPLFPFQKSMYEAGPAMLAACREGLVAVQRYRLPGQVAELYVRPKLKVEGAAPDNWMTDDGLTLSAPAAYLPARTRIRLRGSADYARFLNKPPAAHAELVAPGRPPRPLKADLAITNSEYQITLDLQRDDIPDGADARIRLTFDAYFLGAEHPEAFGPNNDRRRLVMQAPSDVALLPAP